MKSRPARDQSIAATRYTCMFAYLAQQPQDLEAAAVDLKLWRARKAHHAICERVDHVHEVCG